MSCTAIILAAGRGERMRPLTDHCPKPLLQVRGKPLMQWPLEALARAGVSDVMVNTAWLSAQIPAFFGDRFVPADKSSLGAATLRTDGAAVRMHYSDEGRDFGAALETAGGIVRVLPQLADPFWVLAGDVFAPDFEFAAAALNDFRASGKLAQIWLVPNPPHNPAGDFGLSDEGLATLDGASRLTYSTVGLYRHAFFAPPYCDIAVGNPQGIKAPLAPMLRTAMGEGLVSARRYTGLWVDVGTPQRLAQLNQVPDS
jgi:N-acetyl-alpha-D-muramate 1-phosphate uridylyltransferase